MCAETGIFNLFKTLNCIAATSLRSSQKYWLFAPTNHWFVSWSMYCFYKRRNFILQDLTNALFLLQKRYQKLTASFWSVCPKREMKSSLSFTFSAFSPFAFWFGVFAKKSFELIFIEYLPLIGLSTRFTLHIKSSFKWCSLGSNFR